MLVTLAIIAVAGLALRLTLGPIQLTWLTPYLERALAPADQRNKFEIRSAVARLGEHERIELLGRGVTLRGPGGQVLIELPEIEIGLSLRALVRHGILAPASLRATAPLLILTRREAGTIGLSASPAKAEASAANGQVDVDALLAPFLSDRPDQPLSYLERADVSGGELILRDQVTKHTIVARDGALTVRRLRDGVAADLAFELDQKQGPAKVRTSLVRDAPTGRVRFAVDFDGLSPAELAKIEPSLSLDGVELPLSGRLTGEMDQEHGLSPIAFELQSEKGRVERPGWLTAPLPIDSLNVKGRLAGNLSAAEITECRIASKGATVDGQGQIVWAARQITVRAKVTAQNVAVSDLQLYWPVGAGREARDWVLANVTNGVVPSAEATIVLKPGDLDRYPFPEEAVQGRFEFKDLTVGYFETMPPLTGVDGSATFTARRMDFALTAGRVGDIRLDNGSVVITGIGIKGRDTTQLLVMAAIDSPLDQALGLLDHRPLEVAKKLEIGPGDASGQARVDLTLSLPLHRDVEASELRILASAQLRNAGIRNLPGGLDLSDGNFTLKVDNSGADLTGRGALDQIPLAIEWRENFADSAPFKRRYRVQGTIDAEALHRLGLDLPVPATGSCEADATLVESAKGREAELALDLGSLAITVPALGWQKSKGQAGHFTASIRVPPTGPVRIEAFELASAGLDTAGSLELSLQPMQLERLALTRFRAGRNDGSLDLRRQANRGYQISVRARSVDLAPFLNGQVPLTGSEAGTPTPLVLTLVADRVLFGERGLSNIDLDLVRDAQGWRTGVVQGRLPQGGKVQLRLTAGDHQRELSFTSDDAGDLMDTMEQSNRIQGGKLELKATLLRQVPALEADGRIRVKDFTLLNAPLLARLLTVASLTGIGNLLGGKGIHFDRLDLPFTLRPDRVVVIDKGRMSGSQVGFTVRGRVDIDHDRLDLNGTIVPIYGLNWVLSKVPLVGPFLAGREGEGAFAVTYSVTGPFSEPQISVNPLSVLAPGFIRDLFSDLMNGSSEAVPAIAPK